MSENVLDTVATRLREALKSRHDDYRYVLVDRDDLRTYLDAGTVDPIWSAQEIERLRGAVERQMAVSAERATECDRLRAALAKIATGKARDGGVADPQIFAIQTLQGSSDETSERLDPEKRYPIPVKEIVWRLEGESGNTDTDPRWLAANLLRQMENWENRTLMCRIDQRPSIVQFTEKACEEPSDAEKRAMGVGLDSRDHEAR